MEGTIYKIENKVTGKVYIGQTVQSLKRRVRVHFWALEKGKHDNAYLQSSYDKYGKECFNSSLLETCDTDDLDTAEVFWIAYYKAFKGVYNLESGGGRNKELHESTRKKMSIITKSHGWVKSKHPFAKKVIRLNDMKVYGSMIEAAEEIGTTTGNIYQNCIGNNGACLDKTGVWNVFKYYKEGEKYEYKEYDDSLVKKPKKVICVNTREIYKSTQEASKKTGVSQSKISMCCNGKRRFAGKTDNGDYMVWEFVENYDSSREYKFDRCGKFSNHKRKVRCVTTGKEFNTIVEAAKEYNIKNSSNLTSACKGVYKSSGKLPDGTKLKWEYVD